MPTRQAPPGVKYMFTCFATHLEEELKKAFEPICRYFMYGRETCPTTGRKHLQGFIYLKNPMRITALQKVWTMTYKVANGTVASNKKYCSKGDQPKEQYELLGAEGPDYGKNASIYEFGDPTEAINLAKQGGKKGGEAEKKRWSDALEKAKQNKIDEIPADIQIKYYSTIKKIALDHAQPQAALPQTTGIWIWGPSGVGKSRRVREDWPNHYLKAANKWWDGYQGQENVYLEDLGMEHHVLGHHIKLWSDRYDFIAEIKGGSIRARPLRFIITSQYSIEQIWVNSTETVAALQRRFEVIHMQ